MVGFVIVSHSETLANGVVELTKMMADGVPIRAAGGLDGGGFGTSYEKISNAIEEIYSDDGVIVLMDMGSAVMTAEMVLEAMPERKLVHDLVEAAAGDGADGRGDRARDQRAVGQDELPLRHGLEHHFRRHDSRAHVHEHDHAVV